MMFITYIHHRLNIALFHFALFQVKFLHHIVKLNKSLAAKKDKVTMLRYHLTVRCLIMMKIPHQYTKDFKL